MSCALTIRGNTSTTACWGDSNNSYGESKVPQYIQGLGGIGSQGLVEEDQITGGKGVRTKEGLVIDNDLKGVEYKLQVEK